MVGRWYVKPVKLLAAFGLPFILLGLLLVWLGMSTAPVGAATLNVATTSGEDTPSCGSESDPCQTIGHALVQRAVAGDVVYVWAGTYVETFSMEPGVVISGSGAAVTIIEGNGSGPVVSASGSTITRSAVLRGLTVRGGSSATDGGGLSITGGASPVIADCIVSDNQAANYGGGIYVDASSPVITGTLVLTNSAVRGGGIYVSNGASPQIYGVELRSNRASGTATYDGGGGLYVDGSLTLTATQFISNSASLDGGGLYQFGAGGSGEVGLAGGRLERNAAAGSGGGLYASGSAILTGTLVISNVAASHGGGLCVEHNVAFAGGQAIGNRAGGWGGGLYQNDFYDQVRIAGGRFEGNEAMGSDLGGGGLFASSPATIEGTLIVSNTALEGGGAFLAQGGVLTDVQVLSNTAGTIGGGVYHRDTLEGGTWLDLVGGHFERNVATGSGGALFSNANVSMMGTLVLDNSAVNWGGGLYINTNLDLADTLVVSNTAGQGGGLYQAALSGRVEGIGGLFERNASTTIGGGMSVMGTMTLTATQVLSNAAGSWGGGLNIGTGAVLIGVQVVGNRAAQSGGGLYLSSDTGHVDVVGGRFEGNVAVAPDEWNAGGGLYAYGSVALTGTQVIGNSSGGAGGGGLYAEQAVQATNSLFAANTAPNGAGLYLNGASGTQVLRHVTVASGTVASGSAIFVNSGAVGIINTIIASYTTGILQVGGALSEDYNLFFGNGTDVNPIGGTFNSGGHSLFDGDPRFMNPAAGLYHIDTDSAALDAGAFLGVITDMDGEARPTNPALPDAPDIGCDENKSLTVRRPVTDTITFGAACARLVFTDTGSLGAQDHVTITVVPGQFPSNNPADDFVSRSVFITPSSDTTINATLTLCYEQDEVGGGLTEAQLQLYRWAGSETRWASHASIVDTVNNVVTGTEVSAFSPWAIGSGSPTVVGLRTFRLRPSTWTPELLWVLCSLVLTGAVAIRQRRRGL